MTAPDNIQARFNAAFPWFDHARWAWTYDPQENHPSHWYEICNTRPDAAGDIAVYMAGATHDQWVAVKRWLVREFNPKYDIPATHLLPQKMPTGHRHGSTLPQLQ